ncbi:MAG: hypothetical protein K9K66_07605 [Desulfarculaceae bacterium]|nr:hypothetical protein [Desulfarculaceae bacterium]MCF8071990.1 hypothetical protein [Desulfarculaceae bacterium]MCF8101507.1 hypothetical protein [Desulfarculaceae bacterium]MCF8115057.1 hypothetical protein [Desulfarculaceae bacterium]
MSKNTTTDQAMVPMPHGGAIKAGKTHGARALEEHFKAGKGIDRRTREGKLYDQVKTALLELVEAHQGRACHPLEYIAAEQVAQAYTIQRVLFEYAMGNPDQKRQDGPLPALAERYSSHVNNLGRALDRLARMLGSNKQALESSLAARLAAMAKPADQGEVIEAEVVDHE